MQGEARYSIVSGKGIHTNRPPGKKKGFKGMGGI